MDWKKFETQAMKLFNFLEENTVDPQLEILLVETIKFLEDGADALHDAMNKSEN